jgi:GNAT superfamily N-acetyltransferase
VKPYRIALADLPVAVLALDEICFPHDDRITTADSLWWIVWQDKIPVAYAGLRICQAEQNLGLAFLCRVGVIPGHRGRGLQKRLIRARERAARQLAVSELVTYCVPLEQPEPQQPHRLRLQILSPRHEIRRHRQRLPAQSPLKLQIFVFAIRE